MKIKGFQDDIEKQGCLLRDINKKKVADAFEIKKVKVNRENSFKEYYEEKYDTDKNK